MIYDMKRDLKVGLFRFSASLNSDKIETLTNGQKNYGHLGIFVLLLNSWCYPFHT